MQVVQILKSKADDGVISVPPGTSVSDVTKVLTERRIGLVVISRDGETCDGILSERDIVRGLAQHGPGYLSEAVENAMVKKVVTCSRSDTADGILAAMTEGRFRHMPVVEDGRMVGLVTIGDVVKARLSELSMEKDALEGMIMGH